MLKRYCALTKVADEFAKCLQGYNEFAVACFFVDGSPGAAQYFLEGSLSHFSDAVRNLFSNSNIRELWIGCQRRSGENIGRLLVTVPQDRIFSRESYIIRGSTIYRIVFE